MEGSGYGIVSGSVGSECILDRVQASRGVLFSVMEDQFLKTLQRDER